VPKPRTLRAALLYVGLILTAGFLLVLIGVIIVSIRFIYEGITQQQKDLTGVMAHRSDEYLRETNNMMTSMVRTLPHFTLEEQAHFLVETRQVYTRFAALYLLDETGKVLLEVPSNSPSFVGFDWSRDPAFIGARETGDTFYSEPDVSRASGQVSVTMAVPIIETGRLRGVLLGELSLDHLQEVIEQTNNEPHNRVFIINQRGRLITHPITEWVEQRRTLGGHPFVEDALQGPVAAKIFYDNDEAIWYIGSSTTMETNQWSILTMQPMAVAVQPVIYMAGAALFACILIAVFVLFIHRYNVRHIARPVSALAHKANILARGSYEKLELEELGRFTEIVSLGRSFNEMVVAVQDRDQTLAEQLAELEAINEQLITFTDRLQHEIALARRVQEGLLPHARPRWPGLDIVCYTIPAEEVGGDFNTYQALENNGFALAVGDISGKGLQAALMMSLSLASLQSSMAREAHPGEILTKLNTAISPFTEATGQNCALCYAQIHPDAIHVANAGCITPIIRRANGTVEWIEAYGLPLGTGFDFEYINTTIPLAPDDLIIFSSDGVVEAMNPDRAMFGFDRFEQAVARGPGTSAEAMLLHLRREVAAFVQSLRLHDDLTIVVVQIAGRL
jgi:sigma-B regulation protein RsbU (phosphoserine phosphatase)